MNTTHDHFGLPGFEAPFRICLSALLIALGSGCSATDTNPEAKAEEPLARFAASEETSAQLKVTSWQVYQQGEDARIVGRDGEQERKIELLVHQDAEQPGERVGIETLFPEPGAVTLSRTGGTAGESSDYATRVARALHTDLGEHATPLPRQNDDSAELGSASLALSKVNEGHIDIGWSMFSHGGNLSYPIGCPSGRAGYSTYTDNGIAFCAITDWMSQVGTDCGIRLTYQIGGGSWDTCHWFVYAQ